MRRRFLILLTILTFPTLGHATSERCIQTLICQDGELEKPTAAGTAVDCVLGEHAIEVDPTRKWAEALGQSLHYAAQTNLKAKIVLFCDEDPGACLNDKLRLESTISHHNLDVATDFLAVEDYREHCSN